MTATPRRSGSAVLLALTGVVGLLAAGLLLVLPGGAAQAAAPGKAWVRAGHFVPGMGAATVELTPLGGTAAPETAADGARYGEVTAYQALTPGSYTATVRDAAAPAGQEPLLSRSVTLTGGEARTLAVLGTADQPRLVLLRDDLTPPAAGTARVRLLSASDTAQAVTVQAVGGPTLARDAVLGETTPYATVPDGAWDLAVTSTGAGTTDGSVRLAGGSVYTVVALNSGSGVRLSLVTDAAGATAMPEGGADTGLGGTASASATDQGGSLPAGPGLLVGLLAGLGLATAGTVLLRRRGAGVDAR